MQPVIEINPITLRRLQVQLETGYKAIGITVQYLCWDQMKLACADAIKFVAPWAMGKPGQTKAQQEGGMKAIAYDLLGPKSGSSRRAKRQGIFDFLPDNIDRTFKSDGAIVNVTKDGRIYAKDETLYRPDASQDQLKRHHLQNRGMNGRTTRAGSYTKNIGRWKSTSKMMVKKQNLIAYIKSVQWRVGSLKASFLPALYYFGLKVSAISRVSAWISRQRPEGTFKDQMRPDGNGRLIATSIAHHNQGIRLDTIKFITAKRQRSMTEYSQKRMKQIADQFTAQRTNIQPIRQKVSE